MKQPANVAELSSCIDTCLAELDGKEDRSILGGGTITLPVAAPANSDGPRFVKVGIHPADPIHEIRERLMDSFERLLPLGESVKLVETLGQANTLRAFRLALKSCRAVITAEAKDETERRATPATPFGSEKKPRRLRGRKGLSDAEVTKREIMIRDWNQARAAGISRKQFCDDRKPKITVRELNKYVEWDRMARNRRARPS